MSLFSKDNDNISVKQLIDLAKIYLTQRTDLLKLSLAEKLTAIIGQILFLVCATIFSAVAVVLLALAIVHVIAIWIPMYISYLIVAVLLALLTFILFKCKYKLIYDPIARTISSKIVKAPDENEEQSIE